MKGCFGIAWRLALHGIATAMIYSLLISGESGSFWFGICGLLGLVAFYYHRFSQSRLKSRQQRKNSDTHIDLARLTENLSKWQNASPRYRYNRYQSDAQHAKEFLSQATKYQSHTHKLCEFHPLTGSTQIISYYKYDGLNPEQLNWYFYWRTQAQNGQYLETSPTYVFMYTYELINGIGITDEINGYNQLKVLWVNYQQTNSDIRYRVLDWLIDYAVVNSYPENPLDVWNDLHIDNRLAGRYTDMLVQVYQDRPISQMPLTVIDRLIDYRLDKSKFYLNNNQQVTEDSVYKVLSAIDLHLRRLGSGIFQTYQPKNFKVVERFAFRHAIYQKEQKHNRFPDVNVRLPDIYEWSTYEPLRSFLTPIIKYTENVLRKQHNHRGRLRVDSLDPEIQSLIDHVLDEHIVAEFLIGDVGLASGATPIPKKKDSRESISRVPVLPKIEIDYNRVSQLSQESDEIFEVLNHYEDGQPKPVDSSLKTTNLNSKPLTQPENKSNSVQIEIDHERVQRLQQSSSEAMEILVHDKGDESDEAIQFTDRTLSIEDESLSIESPDEMIKMPAVVGNSSLSSSTNDDDEFSQLLVVLADMHLDVLRSILKHDDPVSAIHQIAVKNGTMPAMLVETINEHANECIGDLLIALNPTPHFIDDEYATAVERLL